MYMLLSKPIWRKNSPQVNQILAKKLAEVPLRNPSSNTIFDGQDWALELVGKQFKAQMPSQQSPNEAYQKALTDLVLRRDWIGSPSSIKIAVATVTLRDEITNLLRRQAACTCSTDLIKSDLISNECMAKASRPESNTSKFTKEFQGVPVAKVESGWEVLKNQRIDLMERNGFAWDAVTIPTIWPRTARSPSHVTWTNASTNIMHGYIITARKSDCQTKLTLAKRKIKKKQNSTRHHRRKQSSTKEKRVMKKKCVLICICFRRPKSISKCFQWQWQQMGSRWTVSHFNMLWTNEPEHSEPET